MSYLADVCRPTSALLYKKLGTACGCRYQKQFFEIFQNLLNTSLQAGLHFRLMGDNSESNCKLLWSSNYAVVENYDCIAKNYSN